MRVINNLQFVITLIKKGISMITLKVEKENRELNQDYYDSIIRNIDIHSLECTCGRHDMVVHSYYSRNINIGDSFFICLNSRVCKDSCIDIQKFSEHCIKRSHCSFLLLFFCHLSLQVKHMTIFNTTLLSSNSQILPTTIPKASSIFSICLLRSFCLKSLCIM